MLPNYKKQVFEPKLPLTRVNGMLERCDYFWENAPVILTNTRTGWWGDSVMARPIGNTYADTPEAPVQADGNFLAQREALAAAALQPVVDNVEEVTSITTSATNPYADRVDMVASITADGRPEALVVHVPRDVDVIPYPSPEASGVYKDKLGDPDVYKDLLGAVEVYKDELGAI